MDDSPHSIRENASASSPERDSTRETAIQAAANELAESGLDEDRVYWAERVIVAYERAAADATAEPPRSEVGHKCQWCGCVGYHSEVCEGFAVNDPARRAAAPSPPQEANVTHEPSQPDVPRVPTEEDRVVAGMLSTVWPMTHRHPEDAINLAVFVNDHFAAAAPSPVTEGEPDQPFKMPDRIAIDAKGYGWRVWNDEDHWSMVPTNPDNSPIPEPVTWFVPESFGHRYWHRVAEILSSEASEGGPTRAELAEALRALAEQEALEGQYHRQDAEDDCSACGFTWPCAHAKASTLLAQYDAAGDTASPAEQAMRALKFLAGDTASPKGTEPGDSRDGAS